MGNLTNALIFVMCINMVLFLGQASSLEMGQSDNSFYDCSNSLMNNLSTGCKNANLTLSDTVAQNTLTNTGTSVFGVDTGNPVIDLFTTIKNFLLDTIGLGYLFEILKAPYNFLKLMGLPEILRFAIGTMWYGITFFLIVAWLKGGDA